MLQLLCNSSVYELAQEMADVVRSTSKECDTYYLIIRQGLLGLLFSETNKSVSTTVNSKI